jgi:hypothetical protein
LKFVYQDRERILARNLREFKNHLGADLDFPDVAVDLVDRNPEDLFVQVVTSDPGGATEHINVLHQFPAVSMLEKVSSDRPWAQWICHRSVPFESRFD